MACTMVGITCCVSMCVHCRLLGHSLMKHRHLRQLGYRVVSVPWFEWDLLYGSTQKHEYLQQRIEAAAAMDA